MYLMAISRTGLFPSRSGWIKTPSSIHQIPATWETRAGLLRLRPAEADVQGLGSLDHEEISRGFGTLACVKIQRAAGRGRQLQQIQLWAGAESVDLPRLAKASNSASGRRCICTQLRRLRFCGAETGCAAPSGSHLRRSGGLRKAKSACSARHRALEHRLTS